MSRLQERLDFILAYGVEGADELGALSERFSYLNEQGTNVNEMTRDARAAFEERFGAERDANEETDKTIDKQMALANATREANDIVRDVSTEFEILKFQFEDGRISQDEYLNGVEQLNVRMRDMDTLTLGGVRAMRRLRDEQASFNQQNDQTVQGLGRQQRIVSGLGDVVGSLSMGTSNLSSRLPLLVERFQRMGASTGGTASAGKALLGFMTGPAGITVAIAALIPLLIKANERFGWFKDTLWDTEEAAKAATDALKDVREEFTKASELEGAESLEKQLAIINEQIDEMQADPGRGTWIERGWLRLQAWSSPLSAIRSSAQGLYSDMSTREGILQTLMEERAELQARLTGSRIAEASEVSRLVQLQTRMIELTREADEAFEEMLDNFEIEDSILPEDDGALNALAGIREREGQQMRAMGAERLAFQAQLQEQWYQLELRSADRRKQVNMEYAREVDSIMNNLLITDQQRKDALVLAQLQHAERMEAIQQEEEEAKRQEKETTFDLAIGLLESLQGFGEVIYGQGQENARRAFELNKALALATATVQGAQAVVRAYAEGGPLNAGLVAGAVAAQIAKIAATKFQASGRSSSTGAQAEQFNYDFRGANADTVQGVNSDLKIPDTLRLEDSGGRFLTNLEYARDRSGETAYLTSGGRQ